MPAKQPSGVVDWRDLKYRVEYACLRAIACLLNLLPLDTASALMGWTWRLIAPHLHRHARVLRHLEHAMPELTAGQRQQVARAMWQNLGRVFAESMMLDRVLHAGRLKLNVENLIQSGITQCVFISLHTGNWELVASAARELHMPIAGIYQRVKNPYVDRWLVEMRRPFYPCGLLPKGAQAGRQMFRVLQSGNSTAFLADLRDFSGVSVPFFGRDAPSTTFPAILALTTGVPVFACRVIRHEGVHFSLEGQFVEITPSGDRSADVRQLTGAIQALFEGWIREHPEQWMWGHRRWG